MLSRRGVTPVSYTHLDVYKRQAFDVAYVRPQNPTPQRRIGALLRERVHTNPAAVRTIELLSGLGRGLGELPPGRV